VLDDDLPAGLVHETQQLVAVDHLQIDQADAHGHETGDDAEREERETVVGETLGHRL
jgi:hypothetical protein